MAEISDENSFFPFFANKTFCKFFPHSKQIQKTSLTSPLGAGFSTYPLNNDFLLLTGGTLTPTLSFTLHLPTSTLSPTPPLTSPHIYHSMHFYAGYIWAIGGIHSSKCEIYTQNHWEERENMTFCREKVSLCANFGRLYAIGGAEKTIEWYKIDTFWTVLDINFYIEGAFSCFSQDGSLILMGGKTKNGYNDHFLQVLMGENRVKTLEIDAKTGIFGLNPGKFMNPTTILAVSYIGKISILEVNSLKIDYF